ncbi:MAG: hypothetical protein J3Q66DRAFT_126209 [Benniella sp.]|nr:MAG: hypothetical protein J3Q66DRAFT_126209 [Benniella sp.]
MISTAHCRDPNVLMCLLAHIFMSVSFSGGDSCTLLARRPHNPLTLTWQSSSRCSCLGCPEVGGRGVAAGGPSDSAPHLQCCGRP